MEFSFRSSGAVVLAAILWWWCLLSWGVGTSGMVAGEEPQRLVTCGESLCGDGASLLQRSQINADLEECLGETSLLFLGDEDDSFEGAALCERLEGLQGQDCGNLATTPLVSTNDACVDLLRPLAAVDRCCLTDDPLVRLLFRLAELVTLVLGLRL